MSEEKKGLVDKISTQNVTAAVVILTITGAGVIQFWKEGKIDLLLLVSGSAIGYLFPKQK